MPWSFLSFPMFSSDAVELLRSGSALTPFSESVRVCARACARARARAGLEFGIATPPEFGIRDSLPKVVCLSKLHMRRFYFLIRERSRCAIVTGASCVHTAPPESRN